MEMGHDLKQRKDEEKETVKQRYALEGRQVDEQTKRRRRKKKRAEKRRELLTCSRKIRR